MSRTDTRWRSRYRKQIILKGVGLEGQARIMQGSALVVGAGGLGGIVAMLLVRAGVGTVRIVDFDVVEEENLHRQILFTEADASARAPKAEVAAEVLRAVNSGCSIEGVVTRVTTETLPSLLSGMKVVVDATDNFGTRDVINAACLAHRIPWVHGGVLGTAGALMSIVPWEGPCLRCLYPALPEDGSLQTTSAVGIMNTLPALVGALQVTE
ncbi:MAG: HesA/MoeB/ThiF family protein, partial [Candidatus Eisenbacteria bacterium]|nr:HesA/MoeB/ThiF family protein [Candidatus Eisenbacteria bacterium]